jgi:type I restriction enzyme R subunit
MEEVYHKDGERIDLVIFLNGLAIFAVELKCNTSGQTYEDAINQYKRYRDPDTRLFRFC